MKREIKFQNILMLSKVIRNKHGFNWKNDGRLYKNSKINNEFCLRLSNPYYEMHIEFTVIGYLQEYQRRYGHNLSATLLRIFQQQQE